MPINGVRAARLVGEMSTEIGDQLAVDVVAGLDDVLDRRPAEFVSTIGFSAR